MAAKTSPKEVGAIWKGPENYLMPTKRKQAKAVRKSLPKRSKKHGRKDYLEHVDSSEDAGDDLDFDEDDDYDEDDEDLL